MPGVDRNREQRALLPFEDVALAVIVEPDLGGAPALDHEVDFLVQMPLRIECASTRHLDDIAAPFALGAMELDIGPLAAEPLPWCQRQVLHLSHTDVPVDGNAFRF